MHIAVVTRNMLSGGAERVISQLLSAWEERGVTCSLVLLDKGKVFYTLPQSVALYEIGQKSQNPLQDKLGRYQAIRKLLTKTQPDVVLSMPEEVGIYVLLAMAGTHIPVVVSERNDPWRMPDKTVTRLLRKLAYPTAAGLIFQTPQAASFFSKALQAKGIVLPNPLDLTRLPLPYDGPRQKVVVSAGRLEPQKNFSLLIRAFQAFYREHSDYRLVIYGEGNLRKELEALAAQLPEGTVSLPGVSRQLLQDMRDSAFFVLSSDFEGVPNVLIEAMSIGMPAISTDCTPGGAAALLRSYENGILVPAGDEAALASAMTYMAEHPEEARQMGQSAISLRADLDANVVTQRWLAYLSEKAAK